MELYGVAVEDGMPLTGHPPSVVDGPPIPGASGGGIPSLDPCGGHADPAGYWHWHFTPTNTQSALVSRHIERGQGLVRVSQPERLMHAVGREVHLKPPSFTARLAALMHQEERRDVRHVRPCAKCAPQEQQHDESRDGACLHSTLIGLRTDAPEMQVGRFGAVSFSA